MKLALAAMAVAVAAAASPALAADSSQINWYGTLGYSNADVSNDGGNYGNIVGRVGLRNAHVGVEGEVAGGLTSKNFSGVDVKLRDEYGAYVVGYLPVGTDTELFGRIGYAHTDVRFSCCGVSDTEGLNGGAYGVGAQHFFKGGANGVRFDYTYMQFNKGFGHSNTVGLHWVRKF
jgi:opacity protein-like surface antigen